MIFLRAMAVLILSTLWFILGAPSAERKILESRSAGPRAPSAGDIERGWRILAATDPSKLPSEALATTLREGLTDARELQRRQEQLTEVVWEALSSEDHRAGAALLGKVELPRYEADMRFVEPDGPTLAFALMNNYGNSAVEVDPLPAPDPSTNRHKQLQIAAVLAQTQKLTQEQAAKMLWATLEIIEVQHQLRQLEQDLTQVLTPALSATLGPAPKPQATPQH